MTFPATGNALTSRASVSFRVPPATARPAFEMDGVKYFRVSPTDETATHDPDPTQ